MNGIQTLESLARNFHKDVVISLDHQRKLHDMIVYEKVERNIDRSWKEKPRARSKLAKNSDDSFGFLEYA